MGKIKYIKIVICNTKKYLIVIFYEKITKIFIFGVQLPKIPVGWNNYPKYPRITHPENAYSLFSKFTKNTHMKDASLIFYFKGIYALRRCVCALGQNWRRCVMRGYFGRNLAPLDVLDIWSPKVGILVQHLHYLHNIEKHLYH